MLQIDPDDLNKTQRTIPLCADDIRLMRESMNVSRKTLGEMIDYSAHSIAEWERGRRAIPKQIKHIITDLYMRFIYIR